MKTFIIFNAIFWTFGFVSQMFAMRRRYISWFVVWTFGALNLVYLGWCARLLGWW